MKNKEPKKGIVTMTLDEKCNISPNTPYEERVEKWIELLGYENILKCLPFSRPELEISYEDTPNDPNFSNLPQYIWELGAGFRTDFIRPYLGSRLCKLYVDNDIDKFTCEEGVSILKRVAYIYVTEALNEEDEIK